MSTDIPADEPESTFSADTYLNPYLAAGTGAVDAVVTICAPGEPAEGDARQAHGPARAEAIIIDCSGSMYADRKMAKAKEAAAAAVDCLDEGVAFGVIAGNHEAFTLYPLPGESLPSASADTRAAARTAIGRLEADGGTAIGLWLDLAREMFRTTEADTYHAILLTDGKNEHQSPEELAATVESCRGRFRCDCRGVGTDWVVDELRGIADPLLGNARLVADPDGLEDDFREIIKEAQATTLPKVKLRLWVPKDATIDSVSEVSPQVRDLTDSGVPEDQLTTDFLLGDWKPGECRDYHLRIQRPAMPVGRKGLAGRVKLVLADGELTGEAPLEVTWTDDLELSTRIEPHVAHYTGQEELAKVIQEGLKALEQGNRSDATVKLGRAAQLAQASGHDDTLKLLRQVVDIDDAESGTVRLRPRASEADIMNLDTESVRTTPLRRTRTDETADDPGRPDDDGHDNGGG